MSLLEAGMMASFGLSWPIAAYKTYKCKCVHGKSLVKINTLHEWNCSF